MNIQNDGTEPTTAAGKRLAAVLGAKAEILSIEAESRQAAAELLDEAHQQATHWHERVRALEDALRELNASWHIQFHGTLLPEWTDCNAPDCIEARALLDPGDGSPAATSALDSGSVADAAALRPEPDRAP